MSHCEHEGRAFLKPCPVCALVQVAEERDAARAEVERLQKRLGDKAEVDSGRLSAAFTEGTLAAGDAMRSKLQEVAARQREAAALTAESWGRRQELIAEDKERETIWASAEMHRAEAIMARRIAQAIRGMPLVTGDDK